MSRLENADTEAALADDHVVYTILVELDFVSGAQRLHAGTGLLPVDGQLWSGMGKFSSISVLTERPDGRDYTQLILGLNGVDPSLLALVPDRSEYVGRDARVYIVACDPVTHIPIEPIEPALFEGFMDSMSYERSMGKAGIAVTVKHEDALYAESIGLLYSDEHHQSLFPGDLICDLIPTTIDSEIIWGGGKVVMGMLTAKLPGLVGRVVQGRKSR